MKKFFLGFFLVFTVSIFAQTIDVGGPLSWHFSDDKNFNSIPEFNLPKKYLDIGRLNFMTEIKSNFLWPKATDK